MPEPLTIPESWRQAAATILRDDHPLRVMVVGVPDAGKSSFCAFLAEVLREAGRSVGVVDADVGQSSLGIPGTIAAGLVTQPVTRLSDVPFQMGYFVGDVSPAGHMLACLVGCRLLCDRLRARGAQAVIVDTSGLVLGPAGHELKLRKAELLRPNYIVLIQRGSELASLAQVWRCRRFLTLIELPSSSAAQPRSPMERRARRARRFRAYFSSARAIALDLNQVQLLGTRLAWGQSLTVEARERLMRVLGQEVFHLQAESEGWTAIVSGWVPHAQATQAAQQLGTPALWCIPVQRLMGLLCGLHDENGYLIDVGLLQSLDLDEHRAIVLAPRAEPSQVCTLELGRVRLEPDGTELERLRPGDL
ncbi:MAG: Clp1/GlmU family protein [Anaerolineae bacterium]|nr:Clp1/GlmU family protein [Anaerolineae bacterium]MDW8100780.1 Clp1/GlmU family protein [Anaerolineae bacterium]